MGTSSRVAVIIVNYASSRYLRELLASLEPEAPDAVLVWDNYSTDREQGTLREIMMDYPEVELVFHSNNIGFGPAVNAAARILLRSHEYDFLWILNPDTEVHSGALEQLKKSANDFSCDIISPLLLIKGTRKIWYASGAIIPHEGRSTHEQIGKKWSDTNTSFIWVSFITGAALMIRTSAWSMLGGFDEKFYLYCEDADLSIRARELGLSLGVDREAIVEHAEGGSSGAGSSKSSTFYYYVQRNRLNLYGPLSSRINVLIGRGFVETVRLLLYPLCPAGKSSFDRFISSVEGLFAGLRGETGRRGNERPLMK